jgi:hypothetical protein
MLDISKQYTGVSEVAAPFACSIYPNPTSGRLHIQTEERLTTIDIMTITGQVLHRDNGSKTDIDLTDLSDGSYILAVHSDKGQTTYSRFVKAAQ